MILYIISVAIAWYAKHYWEKNGSNDVDNFYRAMKKDMSNALCEGGDKGTATAIGLMYLIILLLPIFNLVLPIGSLIILGFKKIPSGVKTKLDPSKFILKLLYNKDCEEK